MGNKQTKDRRSKGRWKGLSTFLKDNKSSSFTYSEIQELWTGLLEPDLLNSYADFLLKSPQGIRKSIGAEEFISLYIKMLRESSDEKVRTVVRIIGSQKNKSGVEVISYQCLHKYLSDLLESYFIGLETRQDNYYKSWTRKSKPRRSAIEEVMRGVCKDLQRTDDEIRVDLFEHWLQECGLISLLHSYVLASMYNLQPELKSNMIPLAQIASKDVFYKYGSLLDLSHVVYLNYFLPYKEMWRLLFSTHCHGESFSKFVACIMNQGPIIVVVLSTSNNTFGGFISTNLTLSPKWSGSDRSFLFKLGSAVDVYPATGYNNHYAYFNNHQTAMPNGLGMGGQHDYWGVWIDSRFGVGECSESCTTYKNYKMLDSQKKFTIKSLEVWGVGEAPPTEEEMGERSTNKSGRSALDQDPANAQILEMAGRAIHSRGFRDSKEMNCEK